MSRKTQDPVLIALRDQAETAQRDFERWYSRLKRAFGRCEKARQKLMRLHRRIAQHQEAQP